MPLKKGLINRQPADWVSYEDEKTGKRKVEYVTPGMEDQYWPIWKQRIKAERMHDTNALKEIDHKLDLMTSWGASRRFGNLNDEQANMVDDLRLRGATYDDIAKKLADPMAVIRTRERINPDPRLGGPPEELRLAQEEWDDQTAPIGTGTGVDPRKLPGEWKNGVLEIPSMEGGKGLRIDLNNQPWMRKKRVK